MSQEQKSRRTADLQSVASQKNSRDMIDRLTEIKNEEETIRQGGDAKSIDTQHKKGRLTARERISQLIDPKSEFFELALYAAHEMYAEWGGAPAAGTITGLGKVSGRRVMIVANDATVKAGAFFPITAKKVIRAQNIAIENRIPTIYLVDSSGIFLPLQEDVFSRYRRFRPHLSQQCRDERDGHPANHGDHVGMCVAGGAYLPVMCDHVLMTEGSGLFPRRPGACARPPSAKRLPQEELGGAEMHAQLSGTVDFREPDDAACITRLRALVDKMGHPPAAPFDRKPSTAPAYPAEKFTGFFPPNRASSTTSAKLSRALSTAANLKNIARNTGR